MGCKVLIVEDEAAISMPLRDRLESEGYEVGVAGDGLQGFAKASTGEWDLLILDLMLPGRDGLEVCRDLRGKGITTPVLMLTARDQTVDKVLGLKIGADDYLTKPFEMIELLARVEALLRRRPGQTPNATLYPIGDYVLDIRKQLLRKGGETTELSTQEFKLLKYLCEHKGEVLDRDELLDAVWGYDEVPYTRTVDVHIAWLRQKLGDSKSQKLIITIRGRGYKLEG
ncbi:MAG: response regulator transcription factor [Spirochaetales bacterium]|nr:response regulator transcription factor [Spirochaetales bacterium]